MLAAPCCHHDVAAQLRRAPTPAPYAMLTRHGILRERFADTLTDALRATLMRLQGYRVDVVQFVESKHTPRNTLLRAVRTGAPGQGRRRCARSTTTWSPPGAIRPRLAELLDGRVADGLLGRRWSSSPFLLGAAAAPPSTTLEVAFSFQRPRHRRVQRARRGRRPGHHHQRLRRHRPGLRGRPGRPARPCRRHSAGRTTPPTSRRSRPPGRGGVWVGDIGDNTESRDSDPGRPGTGRRVATRTVTDLDVVRPRLPRRSRTTPRPCWPTRVDRPALRRDQGRLRRHAVRRPGQPLARPHQPAASRWATCCPSPPTARSWPTAGTSCCATTPGGRLRVPVAEKVGRVPAAPTRTQGEGLAVGADGSLLVSSEGVHSDVLRVRLPAPGRPRRSPARPRPPRRQPSPVSDLVSHGSGRGRRGPQPPGTDDSEPARVAVVPRRAWSGWAASWCWSVRSARA